MYGLPHGRWHPLTLRQTAEVEPSTGEAGLLSGVPDRPGKVVIVVTATIDREVRNLDARMLSWGVEKVLSTGAHRVGVATQKFTIDVAP